MLYCVTYEETLARTVLVEADSYDDANDKVISAVEVGRIELNADDYVMGSGCVTIIDKASSFDLDVFDKID